MDKTKHNIPVDIRVIGAPWGEEVFYLEDYVYTFLEKLREKYENELQIVDLYGEIIEENSIKCYLISGVSEENQEEIIFTYPHLGRGKITEDRQIIIDFEGDDGKKIKIESFYIYYSQNEEMQNYLLKWNAENKMKKVRREEDSVVNYGRIATAYNKEEVRIGHIWNVINIVCLGFIVSILAYMVVLINNYNKLKSVEENMEYVMTVMSDYIEDIEMKKHANKEVSTVYFEKNVEEESKEEISNSICQESDLDIDNKKDYYIVKKGDTLYSICRNLYGSGEKVSQICTINNIDNPDNILCGQKLLLP